MEKNEILARLNALFIRELDNKDIVLTEATNAGDIKEWDSLAHVLLIVAIEKDFKIKFTSSEIMRMKNIGDVISSIHGRLTKS